MPLNLVKHDMQATFNRRHVALRLEVSGALSLFTGQIASKRFRNRLGNSFCAD